MDKFFQIIGKISGILWGLPMIIILGFAGVFLSFRLGFFQIKYAPYILKQTFGKMMCTSEGGEGSVSPFQAVTAALASTVGASNIIGVPAAIAFGGPGAIFWMWLISILGMASKFSEVVLGYKYREKNEEGEYVGGPMYYISKGLNMKGLGAFFSFFLMLEIVPSIMVQSNSIASSALQSFHLSPTITGIILLIAISIVVIGGIQRIGKVTEKLVPIMAGLYILACLYIVLMNIDKMPSVIALIFGYAFKPIAAVGGFAGSAVAATVRWGIARGVYSNEAGMGTAPIAHAAAVNDHPVRQGFWAIFEVIVDTLIICTMTAFVVLSSGIWSSPESIANPSGMPAAAFGYYFGSIGSMVVTLSLLFFVLSTVIVIIFYGEKQAEFLFGLKFSKIMRSIYLVSILVGALGGAKELWQFLDLLMAMIIIPNVFAIIALSKEVVQLKNEFFNSEDYYLQDVEKSNL
ncbi:sodium:alanine symporter family protein [Clostridiaceae bacterium 35-E11]